MRTVGHEGSPSRAQCAPQEACPHSSNPELTSPARGSASPGGGHSACETSMSVPSKAEDISGRTPEAIQETSAEGGRKE